MMCSILVRNAESFLQNDDLTMCWKLFVITWAPETNESSPSDWENKKELTGIVRNIRFPSPIIPKYLVRFSKIISEMKVNSWTWKKKEGGMPGILTVPFALKTFNSSFFCHCDKFDWVMVQWIPALWICDSTGLLTVFTKPWGSNF